MPFELPNQLAVWAKKQAKREVPATVRRKAYNNSFISPNGKEIGKPNDDEIRFLQCTEYGDLPTLRAMLEKDTYHSLLNCTDYNDRTALEIATENEHLEIVEYLIKHGDRRLEMRPINESLMIAISKGYVRITKALLKHPMFKQKSKDKSRLGTITNYFCRTTATNSKFDQDITPIMLAAHCNEADIIRLLLQRGEGIPEQHHILCACTNCSNRRRFDPLKYSKARMHAFKALASPAWMSLTSSDPILTAFVLSNELMEYAIIEKEFKNQYRDLSKQCKKYASDLLEMCQSTEEVETLLKMAGTTLENVTDDSESTRHAATLDLGRVKQAIIYQQKAFVAHPHCQHLLATLWYKGMPGWRQGNIVYKSIMSLLVFLTIPVLAFIYIVVPRSRIGKFVRTPLVKFIMHSGTYLIYLSLLFFQSTFAETQFSETLSTTEIFCDVMMNKSCSALDDAINLYEVCDSNNRLLRDTGPNIFDIIIMIFLVGMFWNELKQVWLEGSRIYLSSFWNWLDIAMLNLYFTSFILKFISYRAARQAIDFYKDDPFACANLTLENTTGGTATNHMYYLSVDRNCWNPCDPVFLAEGLYALANVLSFTRVTEVLAASEFLGPLQISLGRMLGDILRFGIVFGLVLVAFLCAMYNLYWYYPLDSGKSDGVEKAFGSISSTFLTLFWALFGLVGKDDPIVQPSADDDNYNITNVVGTILFAVYHVVMVLVMLNMLIAMMSNSYQEIENDEDVEWKFARAQLWISFFDHNATLPIPFNLIPSPKSFLYIYKWFANQIKRKDSTHGIPMRTRARSSISDRRNGVFNVMGSRFRPNVEDDHQAIMKSVVKRYLFKLQQDKANDEVNEGELDEIKKDISSLRFELMEQLSRQPKTLSAKQPDLPNDDVQGIENKLALIVQTMGNLSNRIEELRDDMAISRTSSNDSRDIEITYTPTQMNGGHVNSAYLEHASELENPDYV
ncbi:short transient receptor potential channel 7-like isoform X2 [Antedon mediterranea]|uniref:short transient receptor potential channel 7-like isoform X2 n=1 Tax=Antedon mediterranea TaxID=105859 RepID=UPI003AF84A93